jgi:hypothetical protein
LENLYIMNPDRQLFVFLYQTRGLPFLVQFILIEEER